MNRAAAAAALRRAAPIGRMSRLFRTPALRHAGSLRQRPLIFTFASCSRCENGGAIQWQDESTMLAEAELNKALKAFRKRLKLAKLDEESKLSSLADDLREKLRHRRDHAAARLYAGVLGRAGQGAASSSRRDTGCMSWCCKRTHSAPGADFGA